MTLDKLYSNVDILEAAMQASILRNDVILSNVANADTPGYKKKGVQFEDSLLSAINSAGSVDKVDLSSVKPKVMVEHQNFNYRIDENNVDMEVEMTSLYQNSVKYDTLVSGVMSSYKRINLVFQLR